MLGFWHDAGTMYKHITKLETRAESPEAESCLLDTVMVKTQAVPKRARGQSKLDQTSSQQTFIELQLCIRRCGSCFWGHSYVGNITSALKDKAGQSCTELHTRQGVLSV